MPKPVTIKFEKAAGAVSTYAVNALNPDYSPAGKVLMKPGDEAAVSHFQAAAMTKDMPACFSTRDKIDPEVVAEEKAVNDNIIIENKTKSIVDSSNISDQVKVLQEKVDNLSKAPNSDAEIIAKLADLEERLVIIEDALQATSEDVVRPDDGKKETPKKPTK